MTEKQEALCILKKFEQTCSILFYDELCENYLMDEPLGTLILSQLIKFSYPCALETDNSQEFD